MRIGIEAKWFYNGTPSGKVVIENLIRQFALNNKEDELYIFLDSRDRNKKFPYERPNIKLVYIKNINNLISNIFHLPIAARKYKLDVCIVQNFTPPIRNFKSLTYIHDIIYKRRPEYFSWREKLYLAFILPLSRFSDKICAISNTEKKRLIEEGISESKIGVVYNGVSDEFINADFDRTFLSRYNLPGEYLLYVGRLNNRKNLKNLILSLKYVKYKNIKLVLAGKRDWKIFDIDEFLRQTGLSENVIIPGYIEQNDLAGLYSNAALFCYLSTDEGFGLPPLEAIASGTPALVSDIPVFREIFSQAAVFTDPTDPQKIASAIDEILNDDVLRSQLKEKRKELIAKYSWRSSYESLIRLIKNEM